LPERPKVLLEPISERAREKQGFRPPKNRDLFDLAEPVQ